MKKMIAGGNTKGKTKKFAFGGATSPLSMAPTGTAYGGGFNDGSATGSVKQISQAAQRAQDQLGQAGAALGSGGGSGGGVGSFMPGGGSLLPKSAGPNYGMESYAKGGKVRGYGKARGGRPCKMV